MATMDSLLGRIDENKLDALYLFINETLRDRQEFDRFYRNLMTVLPHNWSILRVEVGHEFLSMVSNQDELFEGICGLESLKTLIISDGYVPRKDHGSVETEALLASLPKAHSLCNLDLQRLTLRTTEQMNSLAEVLESLGEGLEEIRLTGLALGGQATVAEGEPQRTTGVEDVEVATATTTNSTNTATTATPPLLLLDKPIAACVDMAHLRSLAISANSTECSHSLVSHEALLELCQESTTLQDLSLRGMNLDNAICQTLATALRTNSFFTSLDIRQNERISDTGYGAILEALERNYELWCTVMVDNDSFQAKFNALIELNQANRGDLVRSPTLEKLTTFIEKLQGHPTSLWYFLKIHDTILFPFVDFIQWKLTREKRLVQQQNEESSTNHSNKRLVLDDEQNQGEEETTSKRIKTS